MLSKKSNKHNELFQLRFPVECQLELVIFSARAAVDVVGKSFWCEDVSPLMSSVGGSGF